MSKKNNAARKDNPNSPAVSLKVNFEPDFAECLDFIQRTLQLKNRAEVLRVSVRWLEFAADRLRHGDHFALRHPDGNWSEVQMPFEVELGRTDG